MLAAAPAAADEHPEADYTADFCACDSAPPSGFQDVPAGHSSAGSIDCIAYYGVTKGTSATTYSLLMSVSREHMALFLIRLAGIVGIEVTSTPDDPGFTDTDEFQETHELAIGEVRPSRRLAIRLPQRSCPKGSTEAVCRRSRRYDDPSTTRVHLGEATTERAGPSCPISPNMLLRRRADELLGECFHM